MVRWLLAFSVTFLFQTFQQLLQNSGTFWLFGSICLTSIFFVLFCVPETKGKTLDQIQEYFISTPKLPQMENQKTEKSEICEISISVVHV